MLLSMSEAGRKKRQDSSFFPCDFQRLRCTSFNWSKNEEYLPSFMTPNPQHFYSPAIVAFPNKHLP